MIVTPFNDKMRVGYYSDGIRELALSNALAYMGKLFAEVIH